MINPWETIGPKEDMSIWKEYEKQRRRCEANDAVIAAARELVTRNFDPDTNKVGLWRRLVDTVEALVALDNKEELLPCPFCGGEPTIYTTEHFSCVQCTNEDCPAIITTETPELSVEAWNSRP